VPAIEEALHQIAHVDGLLSVSLVDAATGLVLATSEHTGAIDPRVAGAGATDVVNALLLMTAGLGTEDDLEDIIVTLRDRYHIIRVLRGHGAERLILIASLDRTRTTLAMAHREIREFDTGLVA
jgi:hypothetical protein